MAQFPAGWYPNPANPEEEIYWSGDTWSTQRRPREVTQSSALGADSVDASAALPAHDSSANAQTTVIESAVSEPATTAHPESELESEVSTPTPNHRVKLWAAVLAIVALVTAVIPGVSFFTWLFAIPAIILGLVSLMRLGRPRGQSLFAVIGGGAAWLVAIIVSIVFLAGLGTGALHTTSLETTQGEPAPSDSPKPTTAPVETSPEPTSEELAEIAAQEAAEKATKDAEDAAAAEATAAAEAQKAADAAAAAAAEEAARGTVSQQNSLRTAESYLDYSAFSRSGLVDQLVFEGFSVEDANWGVDRVIVDWNEQAAKSAKNYLEYTSFSRSGLIDQLLFEGFTQEQAEFGVSQTGL